MAEDHFEKFGTKVITVEVGEESGRESFTVHEDLIRKSSPFFESTLSNDGPEAQERIVKLPKKDTRVFKLYLNWLYTTSSLSYITPKSYTKNTESHWCSLVEAYLLGDYLKDTNFKDTTMDAMLKWADHYDTQTFKIQALSWGNVYEATDPGSPLRLFLVNHCAWALSKRYIVFMDEIQAQAEFPAAFMRGLINRLAAMAINKYSYSPPYPASGDSCHYHCHGKEPCYKTKITT